MFSKLKAPIYVQVEITSRCNNNCSHCYNFWKNSSDPARKDFSQEELRQLACILGENGIFYVTITGGEPFLRRENLYCFLDDLRERSIGIMINSNATLIGKEDAERLAGYPIEIFLASLMSYDPRLHDRISGVPTSHKRAIKGIDLLQRVGVPMAINMVATKLNYNQVYATGKWVHDRLGIANFSATPICPSMDEHRSLELNREEIFATLAQLLALKKEFGLRVDILEVLPTCLFEDAGDPMIVEIFSTRMCTAGNITMTVGSEGDVRVCSYDRESYGNVFVEDFKTIWSRMEKWRDNSLLPSECRDCSIVDSCGGGCRVDSKVKTGSYCEMNSLAKSAIKKKRDEFFSRSANVSTDGTFHLVKNMAFREERPNVFVVAANPMYFIIVNAFGFELLQHLSTLGTFVPTEVMTSLNLNPEITSPFFAELLSKGFLIRSRSA